MKVDIVDTCMEKCSETCREIVTKERLYERLNDAIRRTEISIAREQARLETLRYTEQNLDEYFEDLGKAESEDK